MLTFITGRGNAARAEIEAFYRQNIGALVSAEVDAQFNRVELLLDNTTSKASYNTVLTRDAKTGHYTLSYGGYYTNGEIRTLTATSLDNLLAAMRGNKDFNQTSIDQVRAQAANIPAVVFEGWKRTTPRMVNPYTLFTDALANFFINPTEANYRIACGPYARALLAEIAYRDAFTTSLKFAITRTLAGMSSGLSDRIMGDLRTNSAIIAAADIPDDPRYGIFSLTKAAGDAVFAKKTAPATGLLVR
jgi:hypothetical protein